jgi:Fe-S-cluster containining protein
MGNRMLPMDVAYVQKEIAEDILYAVSRMEQVFDEAMVERAKTVGQSSTGLVVQCRAGCSACCYDYAMVTATEFAPMLEAFKRLPAEDQQHVRDQNARWIEAHEGIMREHLLVYDSKEQGDAWTRSTPKNESYVMVAETTKTSMKAKTPCSFLKDGKCMIYDARPLACRGHNLIDKRGPSLCADILSSGIELKPIRIDNSDVILEILLSFDEMGLPMYPVGELNVLLERWLSFTGGNNA